MQPMQEENNQPLPVVHAEPASNNLWEIIKFTLIALIIVVPVRMFIAQPFVVSGESMYPTFHDKDYLIVDEISYQFKDPARGEVVIFRYPLQPDRFFIKRIIALPGEVMTYDQGKITIKNIETGETQTLDETYILENSPGKFSVTLAEGEYFVMGDNRNGSSDSRAWGPLPEKFITGRALVRLLPMTDASFFPGFAHYAQSQ